MTAREALALLDACRVVEPGEVPDAAQQAVEVLRNLIEVVDGVVEQPTVPTAREVWAMRMALSGRGPTR